LQIAAVFSAVTSGSHSGLVVLPDVFTTANRKQIIALAAEYKLPTVYPYRYFVVNGGLISYGTDTAALHYQAASYVHRILNGERPADLPVQAPTKYQMVINLKTAKALGVEIPRWLIAFATEVIE
jgi:putative ABC transport system substrate-binding protein